MKKKLTILACAIAMISASGAFAAKGGGLAFGGEAVLSYENSGLPVAGMLLLHLPALPLMFGVGVTTTPAIALTADYWFAHGTLVSIVDWYVGFGGYMVLAFNPGGVAAGGRLPLGLQIWPLGEHLEFFAELAPAVGVSVVPTGFDWHVQAAIGLRVWL